MYMSTSGGDRNDFFQDECIPGERAAWAIAKN